MKRICALLCAFCLFFSFSFADEDKKDDIDNEETEIERPRVEDFKLNEPGDQFIKIGLMVTFPLNFGGSFPLYREGKLSVGGAGMLGYHRFITSWWALGFDVYFGYHPTIGENIFTYIPLMLNTTVQPTWKRLEFPLTLGVGAAMENYLSRTYFPGLVVKAQGGIFFRATPSWSFGAEGEFMYMPQWYSNSKYNDHGNFASFVISARYHF